MLTSICYYPKRKEESVEDEAGEDLRTGKKSRIESVVSKNLDGYMYMGRDIAKCCCRVGGVVGAVIMPSAAAELQVMSYHPIVHS